MFKAVIVIISSIKVINMPSNKYYLSCLGRVETIGKRSSKNDGVVYH